MGTQCQPMCGYPQANGDHESTTQRSTALFHVAQPSVRYEQAQGPLGRKGSKGRHQPYANMTCPTWMHTFTILNALQLAPACKTLGICEEKKSTCVAKLEWQPSRIAGSWNCFSFCLVLASVDPKHRALIRGRFSKSV